MGTTQKFKINLANEHTHNIYRYELNFNSNINEIIIRPTKNKNAFYILKRETNNSYLRVVLRKTFLLFPKLFNQN